MSEFDWTTNLISIMKIYKDQDRIRRVRSLGALAGMPEPGELLTEMLDSFLMGAFSKRPATGPTASCKLYKLSDHRAGQDDKESLQKALGFASPDDFTDFALYLARRYARQEHATEGILILLHAVVTVGKGGKGGKGGTKLPFIVIFKCDFEDSRRFEDPGSSLKAWTASMEQTLEVVSNKLTKCAIYPFFNGYEQSPDHMLIFQSNRSDYFETLFSLDVPANTAQLMEELIHKALKERFDNRFDHYFREPPPKKRELFSERSYVELNDLLTEEEVCVVSNEVSRAAKDLHDQTLKVRVKIDDVCRFEANADQFNRCYFFAKRGDEKFLVIKGTNFEATGHLNPAELLAPVDLDKLLRKVSAGDAE